MRNSSSVFIFIICTLLMACTSGNQVNGRSIKSANRSVSMIKNRLPTEKRIEFEVSYWTLRDSIRTRDEFLDTVDGKTADELIILGKDVFQKRKNEGFKSYAEYTSWDQMIAKYTQERIDQNRHKKLAPRENHTILYKL